MRLTDNMGGRIPTGTLNFRRRDGQIIDIVKQPLDTMRELRGNEISMIFQEPMTSLNPVFTVGFQISEAIILHQGKTLEEAEALVWTCCLGAHSGAGKADEAISSPAVRRHAPAGDDRHGPVLPAQPFDRGRADHRARRDHSGADSI